MKTRQAIQDILSEIPEIVRDKKLMRSWRRGKRQAERGQTIPLSELKRRPQRRV